MKLRKLKHMTPCKYSYICNALFVSMSCYFDVSSYTSVFTTDCLLIMNKFYRKEFLLVPFVCIRCPFIQCSL
jgi:hypothetical protein